MTYSIIQKSQLEGVLRLDAEYYQPEYLTLQTKLKNCKPLSYYIEGIVHPREIKRGYCESGVTFLVSQNIKNGYLDLNGSRRIEENTAKSLSSNKLSKGDLITVRTGEIGNVGSWNNDNLAYVSADCLIIKHPKISPNYLVAYLSSEPIKKLLIRQSYGIAQPHITPSQVNKIPVYIPDNDNVKLTENKVKQSEILSDNARKNYDLAIEILLDSLGIKNTIFKSDLFLIINSSKLLKENRIDAEYFCGSYARLIEKININKSTQLLDLLVYNKRGVQPIYSNNSEYYALTSQFIKDKYIDYESLPQIKASIFNNNKSFKLAINDIVIYTTGAYVGRTNIWLDGSLKATASNHVNILRVKGINPIYLSLVMNSVIGQIQIKTMIAGAAQAELYPSDIEKLVIPILPQVTQQKIADLVQKSYEARKKSKELLDEAKRKVEGMIEKGI